MKLKYNQILDLIGKNKLRLEEINKNISIIDENVKPLINTKIQYTLNYLNKLSLFENISIETIFKIERIISLFSKIDKNKKTYVKYYGEDSVNLYGESKLIISKENNLESLSIASLNEKFYKSFVKNLSLYSTSMYFDYSNLSLKSLENIVSNKDFNNQSVGIEEHNLSSIIMIETTTTIDEILKDIDELVPVIKKILNSNIKTILKEKNEIHQIEVLKEDFLEHLENLYVDYICNFLNDSDKNKLEVLLDQKVFFKINNQDITSCLLKKDLKNFKKYIDAIREDYFDKDPIELIEKFLTKDSISDFSSSRTRAKQFKQKNDEYFLTYIIRLIKIKSDNNINSKDKFQYKDLYHKFSKHLFFKEEMEKIFPELFKKEELENWVKYQTEEDLIKISIKEDLLLARNIMPSVFLDALNIICKHQNYLLEVSYFEKNGDIVIYAEKDKTLKSLGKEKEKSFVLTLLDIITEIKHQINSEMKYLGSSDYNKVVLSVKQQIREIEMVLSLNNKNEVNRKKL